MPLSLADARAPDLPLVVANAGFYRLTGYRPKDVLGRNCRFLQNGMNDQPGLTRLREYLANPNQRNVRVHIVNFTAEGRAFANLLSLSRLYFEDGSSGYHFASQFDVTRSRPHQLRDYHDLLSETVHAMSPIAHDTSQILHGSVTALADAAQAIVEGELLMAKLERAGDAERGQFR